MTNVTKEKPILSCFFFSSCFVHILSKYTKLYTKTTTTNNKQQQQYYSEEYLYFEKETSCKSKVFFLNHLVGWLVACFIKPYQTLQKQQQQQQV